jgi:single-strand DNA-binding protein
MNKVWLTGRIASNLELYVTQSNKNLCEFTIATNRFTTSNGEQVTDFVRCLVWNKLAECLVKYQKKGNLIGVIGRINVDTFQDKDGKNRYKTYVQVDELEFLEPKKKDEPVNDNFSETPSEIDAPKDITYSNDDLPFEVPDDEDLPY